MEPTYSAVVLTAIMDKDDVGTCVRPMLPFDLCAQIFMLFMGLSDVQGDKLLHICIIICPCKLSSVLCV